MEIVAPSRFFEVRQFNDDIEIYPRLTLDAVVTKIGNSNTKLSIIWLFEGRQSNGVIQI